MKKGTDATSGATGGGSGTGSSGKKGGSSTSMPCALKYLAPEAMAAAIIGKGGSVIAAMRQSCNAKITLTEQGETYHRTECRVLTAQANTEESLNDISKQIIAKIAEIVKSSASEMLGHEGEIKLRMLVPRAAVGGVIGKGGSTIKQIRESSGAKISISDPNGTGPGAEQIVAVAGTTEALEQVFTEVNKQIQMLNGEVWFATWAADTQVAQSSTFNGLTGGSGGYQLAMRPGVPHANSTGIDTMMRVAQSLPQYVMEDSRGFAMSCIVPNRLVGGLIGRGGQGTKEIQQHTGTKIGIREIPGDPENRTLNIAGPLAQSCAAYMLMMKRYLDAEAQSSGSQAPR